MNVFNINYLKKKKKELIDECPKCQGKDLYCDCYYKYIIETKKVEANIPVKFMNFSFDNFDKINIDKIKEYCANIEENKNLGRGVVLVGEHGSGKTGLASVILIESIKKGYSGFFVTMEEYINAAMHADDEIAMNTLYKMNTCDFLVIDNVGREYIKINSNFTERKFSNIFYSRSERMLPTIITSPLTMQKLNLIYGDQFSSILNEHSIEIVLNECGDYRKIIKQKGERYVRRTQQKNVQASEQREEK